MDRDTIEAMLSLTFDAPCKFFAERGDSLFFIAESRCSQSLSTIETETLCDHFIETDLCGQIENNYNGAIKGDSYLIVITEKLEHGKLVRDRIIIYDCDVNLIHEFINDEEHDYVIKLFNDETRCVKDTKHNIYYNLDGTVIQEVSE